MALINCPECGKEISDKAPACIHCGFPLNLKTNEAEVTACEMTDKKEKEEDVSVEKGYSLELLDYGSKKIQVATALKNTLKMKDVEALELVASAPCYLFKGKQEQVIVPIIQKLDSLPVEYNLYLDGKLKRHKTKIEVYKQEKDTATTTSYTKKIKCPNCSSMILETSRSCPDCGFDGIGTYLLQLEREKQAKVIDYTHDYDINVNNTSTAHVPKCPTCGSPKIQKVSTLSKAGSVFMWGLLSQKVKKTWHCNNCGSEW